MRRIFAKPRPRASQTARDPSGVGRQSILGASSKLLRELVEVTGFPITSTLWASGPIPSGDLLGMLGSMGTRSQHDHRMAANVHALRRRRFDDRNHQSPAESTRSPPAQGKSTLISTPPRAQEHRVDVSDHRRRRQRCLAICCMCSRRMRHLTSRRGGRDRGMARANSLFHRKNHATLAAICGSTPFRATRRPC